MRSGRFAVCLLLALSFALAPLLCLRYCQAVHAARMPAMQTSDAAMMHAGHHDAHATAGDEHRPPLNELSQMLAAMTTMLSMAASLFIGLTLARMITLRLLPALDATLAISPPPPRTCAL